MMFAWPTSRQTPTFAELIRLHIVRTIRGENETASGPGKTGARFSSARVTPSRSASGASRASERVSARRRSSLAGASAKLAAW
jgi:hypothetical protein